MSKKYRVEQNGQFLGHHSGHTPEDIIHKIMNTSYGKIYKPDITKDFVLYKNNDTYVVNMNESADER